MRTEDLARLPPPIGELPLAVRWFVRLKRKKFGVALGLACLFLPACYDFDFPLDPKPQVPVDTRLVGTWQCLGAEPNAEEAPALLRIAPRADSIALWTFETQSSDGSREVMNADVHGSTVKGGALLNALELGAKASGKWSFIRYTFIAPHILRLQIVDDESFEKVKDDAVALRKEVEKRRNDPAIYDDFCVCVRLRPTSDSTPSPSPAL